MPTYEAGQYHPAGPIPKDPDATGFPLVFNWSDWLGSAQIASVSFIVPSGLTEDSSSNTTTAATVLLSGGTAGTRYTVTCRVTTNETPARVDDRSAQVYVVER